MVLSEGHRHAVCGSGGWYVVWHWFLWGEKIESLILLMVKRIVTVDFDEGKTRNMIMWRLMVQQIRVVSSDYLRP